MGGFGGVGGSGGAVLGDVVTVGIVVVSFSGGIIVVSFSGGVGGGTVIVGSLVGGVVTGGTCLKDESDCVCPCSSVSCD